jgi:S-adenosyl-L-methionine hydrolase (adenosine-forming)
MGFIPVRKCASSQKTTGINPVARQDSVDFRRTPFIMKAMERVIALLTDFGTRDHYVACMKGVILQINPKAIIVDITHEINPQDVYHGAFELRQSLPWFPPKTVFVAVVDPRVGTNRRILAAAYNDRYVLAPDNGLLTLIHRDANLQGIRSVENRQYYSAQVSRTFHGRDIFAPVAAHLSKGVPFDQLGPLVDRMEMLSLARPRLHPDGTIDGQVALIDHFGNLITNISVTDLSAAHANRHQLHVSVGKYDVGPVRASYADVPTTQPVALIGSTQMLEIAINGGNASRTLDVERGVPVSLR